ncbi:hypothetical protein ACJRO7_027398 [Eucalyptus globulus]|uniref:TIR domain-containing protein n=1 Tax=Eucalyptus globulus TaxID=34317 RepID=A0ABD3JUV5_EUCGL
MLAAEKRESTEGASSTSPSPLIPTGGGSSQFDVFLSFNGSDTRREFADHLYQRLVAAGICVFRDRDSLPMGEEFSSRLLDAITWSKISIPIISENYASSKWCLCELIYIMDCKKKGSQIVLPIFYKVDPSDVRHLKRSFGEAFHVQLEKKRLDEKVAQEGKQALKEASYLTGWKSEEAANGFEGELIGQVVETVLSKLQKRFLLRVLKNLVGLDDDLTNIMKWIDRPSINARMVGIYGMGGIGKTTLAKCIYNQLSNKFGHVSFLPDIREDTQHRHIKNLQSQLINDILGTKIQVSTVDEGINMIKSRFSSIKVLILLDDIDHNNQLKDLAEECNWFAPGSIIIVTTRNKALLDQSIFEVDYKHPMSQIDGRHSLILFSSHAFRGDYPPSDFVDISRDIVSTMGGLPLALEVIGSYLYKKPRGVWNDLHMQLKEQPHEDVQGRLKISYNALKNIHKEIFLDIACFFIGEKSNFAMYMWNACGFYPNEGIEELKLRCLIKIGDDDKLSMHDQLRDLGRSIIRQEQSPEKRSRLWTLEEASEVIEEEKGTEMIQAIRLNKYGWYTSEQFKKLPRLRFLQLKCAALEGDFNKLFSELRWLDFSNIELHSVSRATNLHLPKLVVLLLSNSRITEYWKGWSSIMVAKQLKVLDLACCNYLTCTPELSAFTELEILVLKYCTGLKRVHPSIGKVNSLVSLDLSGCDCLRELPEEVGKLRKLTELILDSSGIREIPTSIGFMTELKKLSVKYCWSLTEIPNSVGDLQNLQHLDISETAISILPESIKNLSSLQHLDRGGGYNKLQSLPELPSDLKHLKLSFQSPKLPQFSYLSNMKELNISWTRSI